MLVFFGRVCYNPNMDDLKETIAKNLVALRAKAKLTQLQIADMLNYSDKAVSKWERGEAVPDLRVLIKLSELYNITVDDIVHPATAEKIKPKMNIGKKRLLIVLLSEGLVWFVATLLFMIFFFIPKTDDYAYLAFVLAAFACSVPLVVFSSKWGNWITSIFACSYLIWSIALNLHIFVVAFTEFKKIYFIYIVGAVFEVLVFLWFALRRLMQRRK